MTRPALPAASPRPEPAIARPDPGAREALYLQVANAIEDAVRTGRLRVGERLPAERELAVDLGVSRTTVTGAYQELHARGLLRGHVGRGTVIVAAPADARSAGLPWSQRVSPLAAQAAQIAYGVPPRPDVISFSTGWPDPSLYPTAVLNTLLQELAAAGPTSLYTPAPAWGDPTLREALSGWLHSRGIRATVDEILVTSGAQQGLNVLARAFLSPGDVVVTETPTYPGALLAFRWSGADVVGVPVDHDGLQVDALEEALARYRPKLVYTIPTFQNPTGTVLSRERRRRLLELAGRYRVPIVESDLYGEMYFDADPPGRLKALDTSGVVIYQESFSKIAVPGLRVGWLVAPVGAIAALTAARSIIDLHTPPVMQRLAAAFLGSVHLDRHLAALRAECRARRDQAVASLRQHCPRLRFRIPAGGYYLWAQLPAPLTTEDLVPIASEHGVAVRPGTQFAPEAGDDHHIRLCFAALDPGRIVEGARRLGDAVEQALKRRETRPAREADVPVSLV